MSTADKKAKVAQATKVAKANKKGKTTRSVKTHTNVRFHRPHTLNQAKKPTYIRFQRKAIQKTVNENTSVVRNPLSTDKAMKKMEDENTMVFLCDSRSNKKQIRNAFESLYQVKVRRINTLIRPDGKKKAYIRLGNESDSLTLANKIGII